MEFEAQNCLEGNVRNRWSLFCFLTGVCLLANAQAYKPEDNSGNTSTCTMINHSSLTTTVISVPFAVAHYRFYMVD